MKWQEAVLLSEVGMATRDNQSNYKDPKCVFAWYSRKGRLTVQVTSDHRHKGRRCPRRLSTLSATKFDDWEPFQPKQPLEALAVVAMIEDFKEAPDYQSTKKLRQRSKSKKRRRDREPPTQLLLQQIADCDL